ncbi:100K [Human adenovirus 41]|uniref:Shutoff protein n=1 Tax=Human adenovirus F serotype 41 TaxID=10524 RepID=A0A898KBL5_ADE41|nr:100K [Human adenovirus 41]WEM02946.1 100K [Human mastadenovirus F]QSJ05148.1 100K [Human adenovirus 41]QSJ05179.1 100K [Human adenovirus 41]UQW18438.1 100K [Human adenovirus 41]
MEEDLIQPQPDSETLTSPTSEVGAVELVEHEDDERVEQDPGYVTPPKDGKESVPVSPLTEADYLGGEDDVLLKHVLRQSTIVQEAFKDYSGFPLTVEELSRTYEANLFSPRVPPKKQANGTCEPNPRLNFYPVFAVPEALATYHIFFKNQRIPLSCRANRTQGDRILHLKAGAHIPEIVSLEEVPKIFEGLGKDEKRAANALQKSETENQNVLVELDGDNARLAVLKRTIEVSHFAYPALNLPPKVMRSVMDHLLIKRVEPLDLDQPEQNSEDGQPVVSDDDLARWLDTHDPTTLQERRKMMMAVILITVELECLQRFFANPQTLRKIEESLHYAFRHGYVRQACKISNVELSNLVSYMGILHENRLGQNVLHCTLQGEARRDYVRDCIYLFLILTWQTAMGVWQQCLEERNLRELEKLLVRNRRELWTAFSERTAACQLADLIFPERLMQTLQNGLPDFVSQSILQNFRSFILERSGILPAMSCALPSDFVPLCYRECPPPLWSHCYLLRLANYLAHHSDLMENSSGEGLLECHCRCNLCTPHRSLVCNTELLNETQVIGTFEIQGPEQQEGASNLKLTPALWTSAYLRKFIPEDYHAHQIKFYEDQSRPPKAPLTACVITQSQILAQLQTIQQARQEFLLKKGHGVYLDPQTGEELNTPSPSAAASCRPQKHAAQREQASHCGSAVPKATETARAVGRGGGILGRQPGRGSFRRGGNGELGKSRRGAGGQTPQGRGGRNHRQRCGAVFQRTRSEPASDGESRTVPAAARLVESQP